jgi:beta-fructofuranosidase
VLALPDEWIWDFWLCRDGLDWHIYFLKANKALLDPNLRHRNVSIGHAVSRDLKAWTYLGTCFRPSSGPAFDDWTTWTGSVVRDETGLWHLFYNGTSRADDGMKQRIGHATSTDGHGWVRAHDTPCLDLSGTTYEDYLPSQWFDRAMRDPWVMRDPDKPGWLMFFTARVAGIEEPNAGGAIGFATSPDLKEWTLQEPVYAGGDFGQLEVPQVIVHEGRWYLMFCTDAEHWSKAYRRRTRQSPVAGSHYLMARHPRGPWTVAPGRFFDGSRPCRRYSGKLVDTDSGLAFMAVRFFDQGIFLGDVTDPFPVSVGPDGRLRIVEPAS